MRRTILSTIALLSVAGLSRADLKVPNSVFKMNELGEAKSKAAQSAKPLIFVYTDPGTT